MPPTEDFASAALRHARDAAHLSVPGIDASLDQAWHLAGFAHECARKACVRDGWVPKLLGHDFAGSTEQVIELAVALDPRASRFPISDWLRRYPSVATWTPEHRYDRTGESLTRDVEALVRSARDAVDDAIIALFLDGELAPESLR